MDEKELASLLTRAREAYYNTGKFLRTSQADRKLLLAYGLRPAEIDDRVYDLLEKELRRINPKNKVLQATRAAPAGKAVKVPLKYWMGSLDKIYPPDAPKWLASHQGPYIVGNKMDGTSVQLSYTSDGIKLYKTGDGVTGQDVSFLVPHLKLPRLKVAKTLDIRAEAIMPVAAFEQRWSKEYKNARNLASGVFNSNTAHPAVKDIDIVVFEILGSTKKPSDQLEQLKSLGFKVAPYTVETKLTTPQLEAMLARRRTGDHKIDGLVITQDIVSTVRAGKTPEHAIAFKVNQVTTTKVLDVVWEVSKHGALKPRIQIEPLELDGVTVNYATGHNAYFILHGHRWKDALEAKKQGIILKDTPVGKGAVVEVTRSGDVIPHIVQVIKGVRRPDMPDQEYTMEGVEAMAVADQSVAKQKQIEHFFNTLKIDGIKLGTVVKLYNHGLTDVFQICHATVDQLMEIEGIQQRSATSIVNNIKKGLDKATLPQLMDASSVFGSGLGTRNLGLAVTQYPDILTMKGTTKQLTEAFQKIAGFSDIRAKQLAEALPAFKEFYKKLGVKVKTATVPKGSALSDKTVVFTGFRSRELEDFVVNQGGTVGGSVTRNTAILVTSDNASRSTKTDKAEALGVTVLTESQFRRKYRV